MNGSHRRRRRLLERLFTPLPAGVGSSARLRQPAPVHSGTFRAHTLALARAARRRNEMNDAIANYRAH